MPFSSEYEKKLQREIEYYHEVKNVHELPDMFHYWSNKFLLPMLTTLGFQNSPQLYARYLSQACKAKESCYFVSVGAGNCDIEIALVQELLASGHRNFTFECVELNPHMLQRGQELAIQRQVAENLIFTNLDIVQWQPKRNHDIVIANQSLHHFVELEILFDKIATYLEKEGYFLTHDIIGRNGHLRWPEVLDIVNAIWSELPTKYKYNHQLKRLENDYIDWDCSTEGLEGIRAQDILPLLVEKFHFELFAAWGGIIDIFIDRSFGHNFDPSRDWDRTFVDMLHYLNMCKIYEGTVKPTQMIAALTTRPVAETHCYNKLTPQFCLRKY